MPYQKVMSVSAIVNAAGANFVLLGPSDTMVKSTKPLIAVGAVGPDAARVRLQERLLSF